MPKRIYVLCIWTLLVIFEQDNAWSQAATSQSGARVAVTVVMAEEWRYGVANWMILRKVDDDQHDIIVLRPGTAMAHELSAAVLQLLTIRQRMGDQPASAAMMRVRRVEGRPARVQRQLPWSQRVITDLQKAELRHVEGVGRVRAVDIWLPAQNRRLLQR